MTTAEATIRPTDAVDGQIELAVPLAWVTFFAATSAGLLIGGRVIRRQSADQNL